MAVPLLAVTHPKAILTLNLATGVRVSPTGSRDAPAPIIAIYSTWGARLVGAFSLQRVPDLLWIQ